MMNFQFSISMMIFNLSHVLFIWERDWWWIEFFTAYIRSTNMSGRVGQQRSHCLISLFVIFIILYYYHHRFYSKNSLSHDCEYDCMLYRGVMCYSEYFATAALIESRLVSTECSCIAQRVIFCVGKRQKYWRISI